MSTAQAPAPESSKSPSSREIAAGGTQLADLLNALDNGVRITGIVLAVDEPRHVTGTSGKGRGYDFWNQKVQIWTGNKAVECTIRKDNLEDLPKIPQGVKGSFRVTNGRTYNGSMVFDIDV